LRIGFDLDGVLCDIDIPVLRILDNLPDEQKESVEEWYYRGRVPMLNPYMFKSIDDKIFIITGRSKHLLDITKNWIKRFLPDVYMRGNFYVVGDSNDLLDNENTEKEIDLWVKRRMQEKADMINKLKIDVFFDDTYNTPILRKLCPNTKIIQYGGQL